VFNLDDQSSSFKRKKGKMKEKGEAFVLVFLLAGPRKGRKREKKRKKACCLQGRAKRPSDRKKGKRGW